MGQKRDEGMTMDVVAPSGVEILFGELYRINKWNGIAMAHVLATDPELGFALMIDSQESWYVQVPSGLTAALGDTLWWSATDGFKAGPTDLVAAGTTNAIGPACKVVEAKDGNNIVGIKVLQA